MIFIVVEMTVVEPKRSLDLPGGGSATACQSLQAAPFVHNIRKVAQKRKTLFFFTRTLSKLLNDTLLKKNYKKLNKIVLIYFLSLK